MAHGLTSVIKRHGLIQNCANANSGSNGVKPEGVKTGIGSRRIFSPQFKLQVLDSYRNDSDCKGNQRATARKYGIHRRQIQKWLQVEENLRNSVNSARGDNKSAMALNVSRQPDDVKTSVSATVSTTASFEASTGASYWSVGSPPCPSVRPYSALDYTTRFCNYDSAGSESCSPLASPDPATPIDLSFKRTELRVTPVPVMLPAAPTSPRPLLCCVPSPTSGRETERCCDEDVWDLSTKKRLKRKSCDDDAEMSQKPVKLFKPYLDDFGEDGSSVNNNNSHMSSVVYLHTPPPPPLCCQTICDNNYYYSNNNNNICCSALTENSYTLHELQPNCHFYPPDYDVRSYCDISYATSSSSLKQRQSYSLDFKLSAIDCFYQDSICKGNQRAVASKYNIHRRQVQKWLKQADELKLKNETQSVR